MPKALTIAGMAVAGLLLLVFLLDVAVGIPFGGISMVMDIAFLLAAGMLGYVSWAAYREVK
ncbi:MAG: hypothetical protein HYS13_10565 [Planctomycetia bacterium]|nr:hypothetical protein [Planctomycetia bacterium]